MRQITSHKVNGLNEALAVDAVDPPGAGGACHRYTITTVGGMPVVYQIDFQDGPLNELGPNGVSNEALIAIVIDRLQGFQSGDYRCRENAIALTHLEDAMHWLQHRTRERLARGVEGTSQK